MVESPQPSPLSKVSTLMLLFACVGCKKMVPCYQRHVVSDELLSRTGAELGPGCGLMGGTVPPSVAIDEGITEDEAVALAFWNNASYHELLAQLGISRAQLYNEGAGDSQ